MKHMTLRLSKKDDDDNKGILPYDEKDKRSLTADRLLRLYREIYSKNPTYNIPSFYGKRAEEENSYSEIEPNRFWTKIGSKLFGKRALPKNDEIYRLLRGMGYLSERFSRTVGRNIPTKKVKQVLVRMV